MARRVAQKNGLAPVSDFDAVRLLRAKGIDPFQRANMLELVVPPQQAGAGGANPLTDLGGVGGEKDQLTAQLPARTDAGTGRVQLPQTMPLEKPLQPSAELSPADRRAIEIKKIQRDIKSRRRRKMMQLMTRLSVFVFLPTFMAVWYFFVMATPMYAVKSEFLILQADNVGGSGLGNLLTGSALIRMWDLLRISRRTGLIRFSGSIPMPLMKRPINSTRVSSKSAMIRPRACSAWRWPPPIRRSRPFSANG
jgi:capsular polysaccharide transport system permease protein